MTPDDMEAVVSEWLEASETKPRTYPVLDPAGVNLLRALLLDYQERGRALERIANLEGTSGFEQMPNQRPGVMRQVFARDIARATLKGKSHD